MWEARLCFCSMEPAGASVPGKGKGSGAEESTSRVPASIDGPSGNLGHGLLLLKSGGLNLLHAVPLLRFKLCYRCAFRPAFLLSVASHLPQKDMLWTRGGSQEADPVFIAVQSHHFVTLPKSLQLAVLSIPCFSVQLTHGQCFAAEFPASDFPALFGDQCFPSFVLC